MPLWLEGRSYRSFALIGSSVHGNLRTAPPRLLDLRSASDARGTKAAFAAHEISRKCGMLSAMNQPMIYPEECYAIRGAVYEVYREMGNGFKEEVYQQCLEREFGSRGIPFDAKKELRIFYKGVPIEKTYIPDFLCYGKIIVEIKAVETLTQEHRAQLLNYLRLTGCKLGLLVNFGAYPKAVVEQWAN